MSESKIHVSHIILDTLEKVNQFQFSLNDETAEDASEMASMLERNIDQMHTNPVGKISPSERAYVDSRVVSHISFLKAKVRGVVRHSGNPKDIAIVKDRVIPTLEKFRTILKGLSAETAVAATESLTVQLSKLTTKARHELKDDQFALPGRRYPIPDKQHARDAKARGKQMLDKGYLSKAEYDIVVKRADEVLDAE